MPGSQLSTPLGLVIKAARTLWPPSRRLHGFLAAATMDFCTESNAQRRPSTCGTGRSARVVAQRAEIEDDDAAAMGLDPSEAPQDLKGLGDRLT
jgi:hypothetical protein